MNAPGCPNRFEEDINVLFTEKLEHIASVLQFSISPYLEQQVWKI
jgi:hypothetical protein